MQDYRGLQVWQRAHQLALLVYEVTQDFPQEERYGLRSQMRRAAVSIPSNVAEGSGRGSANDFARFLRFSGGSVNELEYQVILARDLGYLNDARSEQLFEQCTEVRRMLSGLLKKLVIGN